MSKPDISAPLHETALANTMTQPLPSNGETKARPLLFGAIGLAAGLSLIAAVWLSRPTAEPTGVLPNGSIVHPSADATDGDASVAIDEGDAAEKPDAPDGRAEVDANGFDAKLDTAKGSAKRPPAVPRASSVPAQSATPTPPPTQTGKLPDFGGREY